MEKIAVFLIPVLLGVILFRVLIAPIRLAVKLALHAAAGLLSLLVINFLAPFSGVLIPVNAVTVLVSGIFGLPGTALLILLELVPA